MTVLLVNRKLFSACHGKPQLVLYFQLVNSMTDLSGDLLCTICAVIAWRRQGIKEKEESHKLAKVNW